MGFSVGGKASAQLGVFGFELRQAVAQRADRLGDFALGEAWCDVLLAIPIERLQPKSENAFELGFVL